MSLQCNRCHARLKSGHPPPGGRAKCPNCGNTLIVPAMGRLVVRKTEAMQGSVSAGAATANGMPSASVNGMPAMPSNAAFSGSPSLRSSQQPAMSPEWAATEDARSGAPVGLIAGVCAGVVALMLLAVIACLLLVNDVADESKTVAGGSDASGVGIDLPPEEDGNALNGGHSGNGDGPADNPLRKGNAGNPEERPSDGGGGDRTKIAKDTGETPPLELGKQPKKKKDGRLGKIFAVEFMGSRATGKRFCIIADRSTSMNARVKKWNPISKQPTYQGRRLRRMDVLKEELVKTLYSLQEGAEFCVIFYSSGSLLRQPGDIGWRKGATSDVDHVANWVKTVGTRGGTQPYPAFVQALTNLNPRPDVIFFMTDGQIPSKTPRQVSMLNQQEPKVVINTIQFGSNTNPFQPLQLLSVSPNSPMRRLFQIAQDSGGTFRDYHYVLKIQTP